MLTRLFPKSFVNRFEGHGLALWMLGALIALNLLVSINSIVNTQSVVVSADRFPLDDYGIFGAQAVLMLFASSALGRLMLALIALLALIRYRAMVPLVYLLLLVEYAGRRMIIAAYDVERVPSVSAETISVGSYLNTIWITLMLAGFALSFWPRKRDRDAAVMKVNNRE